MELVRLSVGIASVITMNSLLSLVFGVYVQEFKPGAFEGILATLAIITTTSIFLYLILGALL